MYRMLRDGEADIMLSGGRTQFIALKAKTPWLDINQERHQAFAGYTGMVELVRCLDLALSNPIWSQIRAPAPFDADGRVAKVARRNGLQSVLEAAPDKPFLRKFAGADAQELGEC
jgi:nitrogenase molybdenum-cofactor synthesis protein NifE